MADLNQYAKAGAALDAASDSLRAATRNVDRGAAHNQHGTCMAGTWAAGEEQQALRRIDSAIASLERAKSALTQKPGAQKVVKLRPAE